MDEKDAAIMRFARDYTRTHGHPPTLRQIADHIGLRSTGTVHRRLAKAGRLGLLDRPANR